MRADNRHQTTTTTGDVRAEGITTLSLFSSPPPGGSLYNIRLADDGTVQPSRSRVFKPVKRMKNKQLMAEIPRSLRKRKRDHCQNRRKILLTRKNNELEVFPRAEKQVLFSCVADSDDVRDFLRERLGSGYHLGGVASIYL